MKSTPEIERIISASLLRLRMKSPFFATLALFANFRITQALPTAATDGLNIWVNPDFLRSLPKAQVDGLLLHEVLHAALLHVVRRGMRERSRWNVAADLVVNGTIAEHGGFELPPNALRDRQLEHLSAEEIYELLPENASCPSEGLDLLGKIPESSSGIEGESDNPREGEPSSIPPELSGDVMTRTRQAEMEAHWKNAREQAQLVAQSSQDRGSFPAGMQRELGQLTAAQLDWRSYLWRYLVHTPTDFMGFDRRFIGRGLYLENLQGESVRVFVAVDTSGSIGEVQMQMFLSEVWGILKAYPHLLGELYYADASIYGPYPLDAAGEIPKPVGGGGTSFVPFFEKVNAERDGSGHGLCVYLTDGYGTFPPKLPEMPVLWVVTPGGLDLEGFPFGETVRLLSVIPAHDRLTPYSTTN